MTETFASFRLSIDNGFRNEFSYVHYRRWGVMELWEGGKFSNDPPARLNKSTCIEVWLNWNLVGSYKSYEEARSKVLELLDSNPADLHDLMGYLEI